MHAENYGKGPRAQLNSWQPLKMANFTHIIF